MTRGLALQQCPGPFKFQCFETGVHSPNKMMYGKTRPTATWTMAEAQIKIWNDLEKQSCTRNMQMLHLSSAIAVRLKNGPSIGIAGIFRMHPLGQRDPRHACRLQRTPSDIHTMLRREQGPSGNIRYAHTLLSDQIMCHLPARMQEASYSY